MAARRHRRSRTGARSRELAASLRRRATEEAVYEQRRSRDPDEYAASLLRATNTEWLLVDDGFPPPATGIEWERARRARRLPRAAGAADRDATSRPTVGRRARAAGFVALKTIAAYRGGLDRVSDDVVAALEANEATGDPLPVQVHCGFGDADLHLLRAPTRR